MEKKIDRLSEPEVVSDSKGAACPTHSRAGVHMRSQTLGEHEQDLHKFKTDTVPAGRGWGRNDQSLTPAKKLFGIDTSWENESIFSNGTTIGRSTTAQA